MNEIVTINETLTIWLKLWGWKPVGTEIAKKSASSLARLKLSHTPIMGTRNQW